MQNNDELIKLTIKSLVKEREETAERLKNLDLAIEFHKSQLSDVLPAKSLVSGGTWVESKMPINKTPIGSGYIKKNILAIMDNQKQPIKLGDLQKVYEKIYESKTEIRDIVRGMQKKKELTLLKINNSNRNAMWVRTSWIDGDKVKPEYAGDLYDSVEPSEIAFF